MLRLFQFVAHCHGEAFVGDAAPAVPVAGEMTGGEAEFAGAGARLQPQRPAQRAHILVFDL